MGKLREAMAQEGYQVSVAVPPKTSSEQRGLLYEGVDYRLLGENADTVFLMTYEWGYTYGPPMAVAPIEKVRDVVDYAVTQIPKDKLLMGIPNYGYDWPLPYERGLTRAMTIGNEEAVSIACLLYTSMLVSALAGREHVLAAYKEAVKERYRFFSFGDAMFIR